jgi:hypothetical protein
LNWYKYILARLYNWRIKNKDEIPALTVALTMLLLYFGQILAFYEILFSFELQSRRIELNRLIIYIAIGVSTVIYLFIFSEKKLKAYGDLYKNVSINMKKRSETVFYIYIIGTLVLSLLTPIILGSIG